MSRTGRVVMSQVICSICQQRDGPQPNQHEHAPLCCDGCGHGPRLCRADAGCRPCTCREHHCLPRQSTARCMRTTCCRLDMASLALALYSRCSAAPPLSSTSPASRCLPPPPHTNAHARTHTTTHTHTHARHHRSMGTGSPPRQRLPPPPCWPRACRSTPSILAPSPSTWTLATAVSDQFGERRPATCTPFPPVPPPRPVLLAFRSPPSGSGGRVVCCSRSCSLVHVRR